MTRSNNSVAMKVASAAAAAAASWKVLTANNFPFILLLDRCSRETK